MCKITDKQSKMKIAGLKKWIPWNLRLGEN